MEMGNSDNDGGLGVGVFFGGLGLVPTLVLLALLIGISMHCNAQKHEQWRQFCTDVCADHGDVPVIQGSQCYCRGPHGVYDPGMVGR
jgi:hypothetical protein